MSDILFTGAFSHTSLAAVGASLTAFVGTPEAEAALVVNGDEATFVHGPIDAYLHRLGEHEWSMQAEFAGTLAEADAWLAAYFAALQQQGADACFDLWAEDAAGTVLGEMKHLSAEPEPDRGTSR